MLIADHTGRTVHTVRTVRTVRNVRTEHTVQKLCKNLDYKPQSINQAISKREYLYKHYVLYKNMLSFVEFLRHNLIKIYTKTHQTAPHFQKHFRAASICP